MISNTKVSLESKLCTYNPNFVSKGSSGPTIPKSKRFAPHKNITPGPGTYEILSSTPTKSISFPKKRRQTLEKSPDTPGPGLYHIPKLSSGPCFTVSHRILCKSPISPGPGHYNVPDTERTKPITFSRSSKRIRIKSDTPGPGHYKSQTNLVAKICSFAKARKHRKIIMSKIGPGTYDIDIREKFKFAFTKQIRKSPFDVE